MKNLKKIEIVEREYEENEEKHQSKYWKNNKKEFNEDKER
jgi:hypothetical protein